MLQTPKFLHSLTKLIHSPTPQQQHQPHIPYKLQEHYSHSLPKLKQCCKFSRRELAIQTNSLFLFILGFQGLNPFKNSNARAEEYSEDTTENELMQNGSNYTTTITEPLENGSVQNGSDSTTANTEPLENGSVQNGSDSTTANTEPLESGSVENGSNSTTANTNIDPCESETSVTKRAFLDISIDGEPVGRIVVGLYGNDVPFGAARFSNLVSGKAGISYRRKEFVKIMPNYVQHGGVRSYGVDAELAKRSGGMLEADNLMEEWKKAAEKCPGTKFLAGRVGIIVRDPTRPPPKTKLVAKGGKLEINQEEVRPAPNGTEFVLSLNDSPELDASALVVGRVLEGNEVVKRIGQVKSVNDNTSSPYFRVAKLIGDKRAVVAERGFNRPYSKIVVTNCGLIE